MRGTIKDSRNCRILVKGYLLTVWQLQLPTRSYAVHDALLDLPVTSEPLGAKELAGWNFHLGV